MDVIVGFFLVMLVLGIPFGYAAFTRSQRHKENMAMIEKGIVPPSTRKSNGKGALRWGIVITFLGLALCLGLYPLGMVFFASEFPLNLGPWMLVGLIPTFFGLSLVVVYYATRGSEQAESLEKSPTAEMEETTE